MSENASEPPQTLSDPIAASSKVSSATTEDSSKPAARTGTRATTTTATTTGNRSTKPRKKRSAAGMGENTGRWTAEEHRLFLQGLEQHGKGWKKIASLIKSRTVVQIRTHAQKYFQKLAKARQNGEEGDITMDAARGAGLGPSLATNVRRRRPAVTGTKRKALQTIVASAQQRRSKKLASSGSSPPTTTTTTISPILAHFVVPKGASGTGTSAADGSLSSSLEDSLFRFLTPCPPVDAVVNDVARQVGANPISLPDKKGETTTAPGETSPTGVDEFSIYPSWTDTKEAPSWYAKGADVDALLDVADSLDWLADTGDANETYEAPPMEPEQDVLPDDTKSVKMSESVGTLPRVDSTIDGLDPSLPSLFPTDSAANLLSNSEPSDSNLKETVSSASMMEPDLQVFDTPMEEQAFVSTILASAEDGNDGLGSLSP